MGIVAAKEAWGVYKALRGADDWSARRKAADAEMKWMMEEESRRRNSFKYSYRVSCYDMAEEVIKKGKKINWRTTSELNSDWLEKVSLYKTFYTTYEVLVWMYNEDKTNSKWYLYCHVSAANWNASIDKNGTSNLSYDASSVEHSQHPK